MIGLKSLVLVLFLGATPPSFVLDAVGGENSKLIYVDVSLNEELRKRGDLALSCPTQNMDFALAILEGGIYVTGGAVPIGWLADVANEFVITATDNPEHFSISFTGAKLSRAETNYICVSSDGSVEGYGYYGGFESNPGATYKTQRVWLCNRVEGFYRLDPWGSPYQNAVRYVDSDGLIHIVPMESILNLPDGVTYYYADIPYETSAISFFQLSASVEHPYLVADETDTLPISYGSCYFAVQDEHGYNAVPSAVNGASAAVLGYVVEAYLTYGRTPSNGCTPSTVSALFHTWFEHRAATKDEMRSVKVTDYVGYAANGNSYEGLEKTASFSLNEKWNTMASQAGIDPNTGNPRAFGASFFEGLLGSALFVFLGLVAILGIGEAIVLWRRKRILR